MVYYTKRG